ncbi:MAG: glycosyltransferase [Clostridia bacterium]|nr:glycosyltransferase [Clostridia bacterium]
MNNINLQVLVATMNRTDDSIVEQMNISCNAIIANQADRDEVTRRKTRFGNVTMITTPTVGVGINRNIALLASDADILLFSDDDVVYNDNMADEVIKAFQSNPKADVIIFSMDIVRNGNVTEKRHLKNKRLHVWNALRYGTYTIAARRSSLIRNNLTFNQNFGGGCPFSAGEDSLFIKSCFEHGLKIYSNSYVLGTCCKDSSTWFKGNNDKYFYDKGVLVRYLFPKTSYVFAMYFAVNFKRKTEVGVFRRIKLVYSGVWSGKKLKPYKEGK